MLRQWWMRCAQIRGSGRITPARSPWAFRPRLEVLEDRTVPSVILVTNTSDGSPPPTGSLRWAIGKASPGDTIKFVFPTAGLATITLLAGPLDLTQQLNIQGPSKGLLTVDGANRSTVFDMNAPGAVVNISGMTIAHGNAGGMILPGDGGGIANHGGVLNVTGCAFNDNSAALGGGLSNFGKGVSSHINDCTFSGNSASLDGGAIYNNSGSMAVRGSILGGDTAVLAGNTALNGGAIYTDGGTTGVASDLLAGNGATNMGGAIANAGGTDSVGASMLSGNHAGNGGGGIANLSGTMTVSHDTLLSNVAGIPIAITGGDGGGIDNFGTLNVAFSTLSMNSARLGDGGGIANQATATLTVNMSTLSDNHADVAGGGIANHSSKVAVVKYSTLSDNNTAPAPTGGLVALVGGGGAYNDGMLTFFADCLSGNTSATNGGGIYELGGKLKVSNTTIANNMATGGGGGIYNGLSPITTPGVFVSNTTIAGNSAAIGGGIDNQGKLATCDTIDANNSTVALIGTDILGNFGSFGFNLVGSPMGGSGFLPTDLLGVNPRLGALANNGGPTQTMALLAGSPAINAGLNVLPPIFMSPGPFDQRGPGFARIVFGRIDIGAYEAQFLPPAS